jgi:dihydrofolate reductase
MRASVFVGTSVDGFIARPDGAFDFLTTGSDADGASNGFDAFLATVDVIVMGRNTYEVVLPMPAWPYGTTPLVVLSHRPLPPAPSGVAVQPMAGTPAEIFEALASRGHQHAYVDGGETIQSFLRAGLIDHLTVTAVPVLIGSGISLFGALERDVRLTHVATRTLAGGAVQSEYDVVR